MAGRRESIAEGNKDYSYLAGPTSTPIYRGACSTRHIDDFALSSHTHTLGTNGNSGVVRGSSSAKVSGNTVLTEGEDTISFHSVFALLFRRTSAFWKSIWLLATHRLSMHLVYVMMVFILC